MSFAMRARIHRSASRPWRKSARRLAQGSPSLARRRNEVVPGVLRVSPTKPAAARPSEAVCRLSPRAATLFRRVATGEPARQLRGAVDLAARLERLDGLLDEP